MEYNYIYKIWDTFSYTREWKMIEFFTTNDQARKALLGEQLLFIYLMLFIVTIVIYINHDKYRIFTILIGLLNVICMIIIKTNMP